VIIRLLSRTFQDHANPTEQLLWRSGSERAVPKAPTSAAARFWIINGAASWWPGTREKGTSMSQEILDLAINGLVTQLPAELIGGAVVAAISAVVVRLLRRKNRED
jgi:hypothetical protein